MGADAGALGVEVPEGAIERVAGGAGAAWRPASASRVSPASIAARMRLDRRGDALDRLAVARRRARIRRGRRRRRPRIVAVTTTASVREPRAMVKVPAMGKRSIATVKLRDIGASRPSRSGTRLDLWRSDTVSPSGIDGEMGIGRGAEHVGSRAAGADRPHRRARCGRACPGAGRPSTPPTVER